MVWNKSSCGEQERKNNVSQGCQIILNGVSLLRSGGQDNFCNILGENFWTEGVNGIQWYLDEEKTPGAYGNWIAKAWGGFTTGLAKAAKDIIEKPFNQVKQAIGEAWSGVVTWWGQVKAKIMLGLYIGMGVIMVVVIMIALGYAKKMGIPIDEVLKGFWKGLFKLIVKIIKLALKIIWSTFKGIRWLIKGLIIWSMVYERVHPLREQEPAVPVDQDVLLMTPRVTDVTQV
jgi:hypothetical protein